MQKMTCLKKFKISWLSLNENEIKKETGIQPQYARKINDIVNSGQN